MKLIKIMITLLSLSLFSPAFATVLSERELLDRFYQLERQIMAKQAELEYSKKLQSANARVIAHSLESDIVRLSEEKERVADQLAKLEKSKN